MKTLITGANGFIGSAVFQQMQQLAVDVLGGVRSNADHSSLVLCPPLSPGADWRPMLRSVDVVIHTAGMAHISIKPGDERSAQLFEVNATGTERLAQQAAESGVRRFVYLSSIGVNGNITEVPFKPSDVPNPVEPYAFSKLAAETILWRIREKSGMEVVVVRPPLVYGRGAPGNFMRLLKLVKRGIPLPFGKVANRRTFVSVDNLVDLIITCATHPAADGHLFLAGDGEDLSIGEFVQKIATALDMPARVFPMPVSILKVVTSLVGMRALFDRLCGSLQVDISETQRILNWNPPLSVGESLTRALRRDV